MVTLFDFRLSLITLFDFRLSMVNWSHSVIFTSFHSRETGIKMRRVSFFISSLILASAQSSSSQTSTNTTFNVPSGPLSEIGPSHPPPSPIACRQSINLKCQRFHLMTDFLVLAMQICVSCKIQFFISS